jgi:uncharacterized protein (TIGR00255 family)
MTGYGRGTAAWGDQRVVVEMKAVNHRFIDLKLRGLSIAARVEDLLSRRLRERIARGAVTVTVRLDGSAGLAVARPDVAAARRVHRDLTELAVSLGLRAPVSLDLVCAQPGVMLARESNEDSAAFGAAVNTAADQAVGALCAMREAEGERLAKDTAARIARISALADAIEAVAAGAPEDAKRRMRERLARLLSDTSVSVDEGRLAQEVAVLADRQDVTEELVRLRSHVAQFLVVMAGAEPVGRQLDFLLQEFGREVNTLGSKSQSAEISALVVEAKAELEKIREQVQNIE